MKIISWNVNSVRARIENISNYIKDTNPDILLLQEIKTQNEMFPYETFKKLGYYSYVFGQKSYNGVAFLSKIELSQIKNDFIKDKLNQSRIITGEISKNDPDNLEVNVPTGSIGARGTEFVVVTTADQKSTIVLLGPGKNNTLGMVPGVLNVTDGTNTVNIATPGFQSVVFK